ncbi:MAG: GNAT family N-acetyltransferase [Beijerinckiaceae bacterium]|nr:GNAT family N-acetyltransferase [Beijerinckiaceae bacterium]
MRGLTGADFASLADLWVASWREAMPDIDFAARRAWVLGRLRDLEESGSVTVCAINGQNSIIGFVTVNPDTGYLDQLAVAPGAKGTGAAQMLLKEARRLSPNGITLAVNQDNARALAFYEREGFEKIAEGVNLLSGLKTWRLRWPGTG